MGLREKLAKNEARLFFEQEHLDESVFTERSLRNPPRQWLERSAR